MYDLHLTKAYTIVLPVILSYIVWLLQEQKKKASRYIKEMKESEKKEKCEKLTQKVQCSY